jgi:tetratricopeptide (TPR) repeat protein
MTPLLKIKPFIALIAAAAIICMPCIGNTSVKDSTDVWQIRENLVTRLGGEWYKIGVLRNELGNMNEILQNLRDIELFPNELTGFNEDSLLSYDKKIETIEKKHQFLVQQVSAMQSPLVDAMAVMREMVTGKPVEEMFKVIDNDDINRISRMFAIKHGIDSLWNDFDGVFGRLAYMLHMPGTLKDSSGFDEEFFKILKTNLGQQVDRYYEIMNNIKDTLFNRGNNDLRKKMFVVETSRIKDCLRSGKELSAKMNLHGILARYKDHEFIDECNMIRIKVAFASNDYEEVLKTISLIPAAKAASDEVVIDKAQSLYLLKNYKELWNWGNSLDLKSLTGSSRNRIIWLIMESGLLLNKSDTVVSLVSQSVKDSAYSMHILHGLGRYYVKKGDWETAQSVFEGALRRTYTDKPDEQARQWILLTLARTYYERGDYQKSLKLFFQLINNEDFFDDAIFGLAWCYLEIGDDAKAETCLRKLINQSPQSPLASQALIVIMKRNLVKARSEWERCLYLSNEEQRCADRKAFIAVKTAVDTNKKHIEIYGQLILKIDDIIQELKKEKYCPREEISSFFDKAERVADLISAYYGTGTFQEILFSEKRELLLGRLDSLLLCVNQDQGGFHTAGKKLLRSINDIGQIKKSVRQSRILSVEGAIEKYRWEREYIDWQKTSIKRESATVTEDMRKRIDQRMDSLAKAGDEADKRWYGILTEKCSKILLDSLDSTDEAYIRYHLGEIYYNHENELYARKYAVYEDSLTSYDSLMKISRGNTLQKTPFRPVEPVLVHEASIRQYRAILEKCGNVDLAHAVHYSLAWCYNDQGIFDSAIAHMQVIADKYPSSQYCPQAWMYLGEYMFDHSKLDMALKAYQSVLKYPESEWFDKALYKLAWTQYRLSNPEKAIGSFLALVDLGEGSGSGKTLLEKESIDYIAISFSETDVSGEKGLQRAVNFVKRFGDKFKGAEILHRLAVIFKEQGRFNMAQRTYSILLHTYPENQNSPQIESELLAVAEKNSPAEVSNISKVEFFNKYNKKSDWARAQSDLNVKSKGDSLSCKQLYDAAISYHQLALQKNDNAHYGLASETYQTFINNYPNSQQASECHYNLAEIMFSTGNYLAATEEYIAVSKLYPDSKYKENASWNAIVASQNFLKKENGAAR